MENKVRKVINKFNKLNKAGVFSFASITEKKALKKSRFTKQPTPDHLTVITKVKKCTISAGNDYTKLMNKKLEETNQEANFQSKGTYCEPVDMGKFIWKHKEKDQYYLRVYPGLCGSFKSTTLYLDKNKNVISNEEFKKIEEEYFSVKKFNENSVAVANYKLENVKYLKHGEVIINEMPELWELMERKED